MENGSIIAVKQIIFQNLKAFESTRKSILDEMNAFKLLHHPNIIQYYGTEVHRDKLFIFMEYCPMSLDNLISNRGKFPENVVKALTRQILEGLEYLHSRNIIHRYTCILFHSD